MRVALVHDWLTGMRGGEKVLEAIIELFPDATLYTLVHVPGATSARIESVPIRTAFTQRLPGVFRHYRWYLPLFPLAVESFRFEGFDLVLSSSHCAAKGARPPDGVPHICYCHTPMRYVWDRFEDYFGNGPSARLLYGPMAHLLRRWDRRSSKRVDHFVANSAYVAERIRRYYGRDVGAVIPPPVDTDFFTPAKGGESDGDYFLVVSALVPYKRVDLVLEAFRNRPEPLVVAGSGPSRAMLERLAGPNVRFRGFVADDELRELYRGCRAVLLPGVEDFGIVPLEAQACGKPVVALGEGGAVETVLDGETGVLFPDTSVGALSDAIDKVSSLRLNKSFVRDWACRFSRDRFKGQLLAFIEKHMESSNGNGAVSRG